MYKLMKKYGTAVIKFLLIFGIFAVLFWRAGQTDTFQIFLTQKKNLPLLALGFVMNFCATILTFVRWRWLVRCLGIPLGFGESFRLSFLGLIINYLPIGIIGGDAVKAWILAKNYPEAKARAVASVLMDRVIGLYIMFVLGFIMVWCTGFIDNTNRDARIANTAIVWFFVISTIGMIFLFFPESKSGLRKKLISKIPFAGGFLRKLADAVQLYRSCPKTVVVSLLITFFVHGFFAISFYFMACGLFGFAPSVLDHQVIYCISNIGTLIPLSAGPLEYFLDVLYPLFDIVHQEPYRAGFGMLVGLTARIMGLLTASCGGLYYLFSRPANSVSFKDFKNEISQTQTGNTQMVEKNHGEK